MVLLMTFKNTIQNKLEDIHDTGVEMVMIWGLLLPSFIAQIPQLSLEGKWA